MYHVIIEQQINHSSGKIAYLGNVLVLGLRKRRDLVISLFRESQSLSGNVEFVNLPCLDFTDE